MRFTIHIMKISNNTQYTTTPQHNSISFEALKFKKINNYVNIFEDFPIKLKSGNLTEDCFVRASSDAKRFFVDVENKEGRHLGISTSNTIKDNGTLYNNIIQNLHQDWNVQGVGSAMRLGQIIILLENPKMNKIKLFSMGNAVFFHSKFKFKPAITDKQELTEKLEDILVHSNDTRFSKNVEDVKTFLSNNAPSKKDYIKNGNEILNKYLQNVVKNNLHKDIKFHIYSGFDMELTKKDIINNKDFYNNLFNKFGIDYQINT